MKFDSIDHLFIFEQQFWNILLVIEFPDIFLSLIHIYMKQWVKKYDRY